jgi:hypothetical protein
MEGKVDFADFEASSDALTPQWFERFGDLDRDV